MLRRIIILSAVLFILASLTGVCRNGGDGFILKRHELSVSGGFFQGMNTLWPPQLDVDNTAWLSDDYILSTAGITEYDREGMTGTWRIAYTYNATRVVAVEASLNYEGYKDSFYDSDTDMKTRSSYADVMGLMATLRINWLNRRLVRVYSSAGVGVSCRFSGANYRKSGGPLVKYDNEARADWQTAPIGVTIGKSLFALAELNVGTLCMGARFGVGYRF